jgi:hypothetical protein
MSDMDHERAIEIIALCEAIKPLLGGRGPAVQSAVIAQLTAIWLAGYRNEAERKMASGLLAEMIEGMLAIELAFRERGDDDTQH